MICVSGDVCLSICINPPSSPLNECWAERVPGILPLLERSVFLLWSLITKPYDALVCDAAEPSHTVISFKFLIFFVFGLALAHDGHFWFFLPQFLWVGSLHVMQLCGASLWWHHLHFLWVVLNLCAVGGVILFVINSYMCWVV